jgi:hypothetical protein
MRVVNSAGKGNNNLPEMVLWKSDRENHKIEQLMKDIMAIVFFFPMVSYVLVLIGHDVFIVEEMY